MVSLFTHDFTQPQKVQIPEAYAGQRLDNFLFTQLKSVPKTRVYRLIRKGEVRLNKGRIKPNQRLAAGDVLRLPPIRLEQPEPKTWLSHDRNQAESLAETIIYEDERILAINKPAGIAVHGGSGVNFGVIEALRQTRNDHYLELVHRLDKDTSGCLLIAKRRSTLRVLHECFRENTVDKQYFALVKGAWQGKAIIRAPLRRQATSSGDRVVSVCDDGQSAETEFTVIRSYPEATLMLARPKTGRTHQIRVHSAFVGNPIIGDIKYGDSAFDREMKQRGLRRLFLHASQIALKLPDQTQPLVIKAPLDPSWDQAFAELQGR